MNNVKVARELLKIAQLISATEFPSQEALDAYLKKHPDADKSKHTVSDTHEKHVLNNLPQHAHKYTHEQHKAVHDSLMRKPLKQLHKDHDLLLKQHSTALKDKKDEDTIQSLNVKIRHHENAINEKEFGN